MTDDTPTRINRLEGELLGEVRAMRKALSETMVKLTELTAYQRTHDDRLRALEQMRQEDHNRWAGIWPGVIAGTLAALMGAAVMRAMGGV